MSDRPLPHRPLPRSAPGEQGVRAAGVAAFVDALESDPRIDPHGFLLLRHGSVVAEGWWAPYTADRPHLLYSLSKTFTATAVGFAIAEGLLGLDDPIVDHFPEFAADIRGARSRRMRVRDVLAMASGHHVDMIERAFTTDFAEPVRGFLLHEPEEEPGTWFTYNQLATYSVAAIVQRAAGTDLVSYLRPRLLDPLGIGPVSWQQHPPGRAVGFSGLHATTEAIAKLGLLHLQDGVWEGRQLMPEGWATEMRQHRVDTPGRGEPDWSQGYGFQVWMARHGYRGDGAFGQFCVILPEHDVVLATTMATEQMQVVLDAAWQHLLPAFTDDAVADPAADAALAERLTGLRLPPSDGSARPADDAGWAGEYGTSGQAPVRVRLSETDGTWSAQLDDGVVQVVVPIGGAGWTTVDDAADRPPVAVSGGWSGPDARQVLHLDIAFLESPHRLHLELRAGDPAVALRWGTPPLGLLAGISALDQWAPRPLH